ncbi:hypothetical protein DPEC_G00109560 [Dallia pectoralis]|uniref:Uncharacterized protein n=1 Tax=Dallia pectoralis TaxID=75939 RepID=A0ACC2GSS6_DALPE|nr:hypothetical protein DPEC_G00109560 [Dallia pectoralis]
MDFLQQLQVYYWTWPHPHRTLWQGHRGTKFYSPKAQPSGPGITYPPQTHRLALSMFPANLQNFLSRCYPNAYHSVRKPRLYEGRTPTPPFLSIPSHPYIAPYDKLQASVPPPFSFSLSHPCFCTTLTASAYDTFSPIITSCTLIACLIASHPPNATLCSPPQLQHFGGTPSPHSPYP